MTINNDKCEAFLIVQTDPYPESQTFNEYRTVGECLDAIFEWYEDHIRTNKNYSEPLQYTAKELIEFIDSYYLITCLVLDKDTGHYTACYKEWLKEKLYYELLRRESYALISEKKPADLTVNANIK